MAKKDEKLWLDPLRFAGFLPGVHPTVDLHKKKFYVRLVKKGLAFMYEKRYDVDPDSPILRNDDDDDEDDKKKFSEKIKSEKGIVIVKNKDSESVTLASSSYLSGILENIGIKQKDILGERCQKNAISVERRKTGHPKRVLIVGAGISGLAAAYELKRSGHEVIILERQQRVGGRIKTLHFQFDPSGLRGEAGAMRIPLEKRHYLTDAYVNKFDLDKKTFYNVDNDENSFVSIRGVTVRVSDFQSSKKEESMRARTMCDTLWPGWDEIIEKKRLREKYTIDHIIQYYKLTIKEVNDSAPKFDGKESPEQYTKDWQKWMERWSNESFIEFLSSSASISESKPEFRPWPKMAIDCITNINYLAYPEVSVATMLAEEIGEWWTPVMYTLKNGMEQLPEAFIKEAADPYSLENDIHYGVTVRDVEWSKCEQGKPDYAVKVTARQTQTSNEVHYEADAVILTIPLNVLRQVKFTPSLPQYVNDAIAGIRYEPSTKIFLGFRERFWEKGKFPIKDGGISKTNLPIGQIVYPSKAACSDHSQRGVLLLYTWNKEALLFGSQSQDEAIREALREVQEVYKGLLDDDENASQVTDLFEAGAIQSWYTDPAAEGAYVHLLPYSYTNHLRSLLEPKDIRPIFFGGEAISFANGWIQGALESGLRAAWQFYKYNELLHSTKQSETPIPENPFSSSDFNLEQSLKLPFFGLSKYPFLI